MREARLRGIEEGAWQIYDRYNAPGNQNAPHFLQFMVAAKAIVRRANRRGQGMRLIPQGGQEISDDFYHFIPVPSVGGAAYRIYIHTAQPVTMRALPIISMIVDLMKVRPGLNAVKVAGPGMAAARRDTIVIYIRDEMLVPWMVRQLRTGAYAGYAVDPVPSGTKRVHTGISWAEEPPLTQYGDGSHLSEIWRTNQHSYGSYIAGCLYRALQSNPTTQAIFLDRVIIAMRDAKVEPTNPHVFDRPAPQPLVPNPLWLAMKGVPLQA